jgi:hypothetical protein
MLCVVDKKLDVTMLVKMHNLIKNHKGERNGQTVVEFLDASNLGQMVRGEKLHVVGHGSGTTMGTAPDKYDAQKLSKTLVDRGLRGDIDSIKLSGCLTGADSYNGTPFAARYCQVVADEVYRLTKNTTPIRLMVTGFTFTAVTDEKGNVRAKDPVKKQTYGQGYTDIIDKYKAELADWEKQAATMKPTNTEEFKYYAAQMAGMSAKLFDELYLYNPTVIKGKEDSKYRGLPLADL